jgi:hydroxymethylbilane synthase
MNQPLIIATRGSDLALWQANHVKSLLEKTGLTCKLSIIKTKGDEIQHLNLDKLEGKGFFTKEIEDAVLNHEADIAVHSHKDLPTESHPDLVIAAVSGREDPSELLIIRKEAVDVRQKFSLKKNATVGTSSARRKSQMLAFRNDVELNDLRGNVPSRVKKLRDKMYDAVLIASAGVERLELDVSDFHVEKLDPKEFIPAPAQGVLAIQIRKKDNDLFEKIQVIHNKETAQLIAIERSVLNLFHGGCHAPVGVYAEFDDDREIFKVRAVKANAWNEIPVSVYVESKNAETIAEKIVSKIEHVKPASVFITRNLRAEDYFQQVLTKKGFAVGGRSLIEMIPVPMKHFDETDWIFFSSKHAVKFFFQQKPVLGKQKFACVGKATADALRKNGKRADFIGYSTDTKLTGKQFASVAGSGTVLFPQAKGSLRSIQNGFVKDKQVIDLIVYETLKKNEEEIPFHEIVLFTSPSNVEAWFEKNKITSIQKIIAMGEATGSSLKKFTSVNYTLPDTFDDAGLVRAVFNRASEN